MTGIMCVWASGFADLLVYRILVGISIGAVEPACITVTLESVPHKIRGKASLVVQGVGGAVGKILVAIMANALYDSQYNPGRLCVASVFLCVLVSVFFCVSVSVSVCVCASVCL
jgi:MFS family permease